MENDVLSLESKERFRRKLLISTRILAFLLILAIFAFTYVELAKWKEFNSVRLEYGDLGYCYMCGLEAGRQCSCVYQQNIMGSNTVETLKESLATANTQQCENKNKNAYEFDISNISLS